MLAREEADNNEGEAAAPVDGESEGESAARLNGNGPIKVLLVEDNEDDVFLTRRALGVRSNDITVDAVTRGQEALQRIAERSYDLAVLDYKLPDIDGMELLQRVLAAGLPALMVTGRGDERLAVQALKSGAEDYLVKDDTYLHRLPQVIRGAVARSRLDRENRRLTLQTARQAGLLEAVLQTDPGAIVVLRGPDFRFEMANPSFRAVVPGFDEIAPIGKPLLEAFPSFLDSEWYTALQQAYGSGQPMHAEEISLPSASRGQRYFHLHIMPLIEAQNDERGLAVILWEVTNEVEARRKVEAMARQAETQRAWLQAVIDQMPEGVHIASAPDATLLLTNRTAVELLGPPPRRDLSQDDTPHAFSLTHPDGSDVAVHELPLQRALWKGETVVGMEVRHVRPDGSAVDLLVNAAPLHDAGGNIIAGVAVFQDITPLKDAERLKDEFMSIASHELRTPLTSVKATAQLMLRRKRDAELSPQDTKSLNAIVQQSSRMGRLIEELLDVSRLQTGRIQVRLRRLDLTLLAQEVVEENRLSNPEFRFEIRADGSVWVDADRDRIAQVLSNLLDNAVKYSQPGGEAIVQVGAYPDRRLAEMQVTDRGAGFDPSQSEVIFERFSRLGTVLKHSRGMGLGLYISREIMRSHGGDVRAYSAGPGAGATFTVELPLTADQ